MSETNAAVNYKITQMLPRIYRSQMSADHAKTNHTSIVLFRFNRP
jgi:hypothetical protein